jgi:hypothetical protein
LLWRARGDAAFSARTELAPNNDDKSISQPLCQSLKIGNCFQLARTFKPEAVLEDNVCKVQCAFIFRALPKVTLNANELLGFSSGKN